VWLPEKKLKGKKRVNITASAWCEVRMDERCTEATRGGEKRWTRSGHALRKLRGSKDGGASQSEIRLIDKWNAGRPVKNRLENRTQMLRVERRWKRG